MRFGPAAITAAICVLAAFLEGVAAGSSFRERLAELRLPRFSPSFPLWVAIGIGYYLTVAVVMYRLLALSPDPLRSAALVLVVVILLTNAFWNYLFFRRRSPGSSFKLGLTYSVVALILWLTLLELDRVACLVLLPYTLYLLYANVWTYRIWQLNESPNRDDGSAIA